MSRLKHPLYHGGNSMEGVTYGEVQDGVNYVYCGNCGNRIKVHNLDGFFRKTCFKCGCIVTNDGTFYTAFEADTYGYY